MYNFDTLLQRKHSDCTKWDALVRDFGRDDLMPFWVADADFPVLPEITRALRERASDSQTYGYTVAGDAYYKSVINWSRDRHGLELDKQDILPVPGVVTALAIVLMALTKEHDKVLINPPVYTPFFDVVKGLGRELVTSNLILRNGSYLLDYEDLEKKLASGIKAYILCSPHNPVGRVWKEEELLRVSRLCSEYGVLLISDEIHCDIVFSGYRHIPILNVDTNTVLITAPSKTFNIAGLKSSMILVKNSEMREKISGWIGKMHLYLNLFAYQATEAAYTHGAEWVDEMNAYLEENARFTVDYLAEKLPRVKTYVPESTYLMWLDFSEYGMSGEELSRKLIEEAHVALNPGCEYGEGYEQYIRLNIATPRFYLEQGLSQIASAFSGEETNS